MNFEETSVLRGALPAGTPCVMAVMVVMVMVVMVMVVMAMVVMFAQTAAAPRPTL